MVRSVYSLARWPYDLLFNPSAIVASAEQFENESFVRELWRAATILLLFILNVFLYTFPLTYGSDSDPAVFVVPPQFEFVVTALPGDGQAIAQFTILLVENSLLLLYTTLITLVVYHTGIWLTRKSSGWLQSLEIVTLTTGIYLALIFNLVIIGATRLGVSGDILWLVQVQFVQVVIELTGSAQTVTTPNTPSLSGMMLAGRVVLTSLLVLLGYYAYVLYLGAQRVHGLTRYESIFVVGFIAITPLLYVSAVLTILHFTDLPPGLFGLRVLATG